MELLQGNILYNGAAVPVNSEPIPAPHRPVITLDLGTGATTDRVHREITDHEQVFYYRTAVININLWADSVEQRERISAEIMDLFYKEQADYYIFCSNYEDGNCKYLNDSCPASLTDKKKCPDPVNYQYENLTTKHGIIHGCIDIRPPYYLTDVADHPPIYRAVFRAEAEYIEAVEVGGAPVTGYNTDIETD